MKIFFEKYFSSQEERRKFGVISDKNIKTNFWKISLEIYLRKRKPGLKIKLIYCVKKHCENL